MTLYCFSTSKKFNKRNYLHFLRPKITHCISHTPKSDNTTAQVAHYIQLRKIPNIQFSTVCYQSLHSVHLNYSFHSNRCSSTLRATPNDCFRSFKSQLNIPSFSYSMFVNSRMYIFPSSYKILPTSICILKLSKFVENLSCKYPNRNRQVLYTSFWLKI